MNTNPTPVKGSSNGQPRGDAVRQLEQQHETEPVRFDAGSRRHDHAQRVSVLLKRQAMIVEYEVPERDETKEGIAERRPRYEPRRTDA